MAVLEVLYHTQLNPDQLKQTLNILSRAKIPAGMQDHQFALVLDGEPVAAAEFASGWKENPPNLLRFAIRRRFSRTQAARLRQALGKKSPSGELLEHASLALGRTDFRAYDLTRAGKMHLEGLEKKGVVELNKREDPRQDVPKYGIKVKDTRNLVAEPAWKTVLETIKKLKALNPLPLEFWHPC